MGGKKSVIIEINGARGKKGIVNSLFCTVSKGVWGSTYFELKKKS